MAKRFPIYKGLQKPLIYKGFQGKFIGWGIGSLVTGVVLGGLIGSKPVVISAWKKKTVIEEGTEFLEKVQYPGRCCSCCKP